MVLILGFSGCSVESYDSNEDLVTADARGGNALTADANEFEYPGEDVCVGEEATFTFNVPVGTNIQIQELKDGEWEQVEQESATTSNPQVYTMNWDTPGVHYFRYKAGPGGHTQIAPITVVNCSDCEESFSYVDNNNGSYTFTYVPANDMENAEIIFTFAQSVVNEWGESSVTTEWTTAGQTEHAFLDLEACQQYWWVVSLKKDCNGNTPNNNVWTDFKINDVSKKNDQTPNITQSCEN